MLFYLGTHQTHWLSRTDVPLFVSHGRLRDLFKRKRSTGKLPKALGRWALDSRGFSELSQYGMWTITPKEYVDATRRYQAEIGNMDWASIQDWMCEPFITAKTGKSVKEHQLRTVESYFTLTSLAPEINWLPVLQGYTQEQYLECLEMYRVAGAPLQAFSVVGIGSVCRRQSTSEIHKLITLLHGTGLNMHGFGVKLNGIKEIGHLLASADSMAWSFHARYNPPMPGCSHGKQGTGNCANCLRFALNWRDKVLAVAEENEERMAA